MEYSNSDLAVIPALSDPQNISDDCKIHKEKSRNRNMKSTSSSRTSKKKGVIHFLSCFGCKKGKLKREKGVTTFAVQEEGNFVLADDVSIVDHVVSAERERHLEQDQIRADIADPTTSSENPEIQSVTQNSGNCQRSQRQGSICALRSENLSVGAAKPQTQCDHEMRGENAESLTIPEVDVVLKRRDNYQNNVLTAQIFPRLSSQVRDSDIGSDSHGEATSSKTASKYPEVDEETCDVLSEDIGCSHLKEFSDLELSALSPPTRAASGDNGSDLDAEDKSTQTALKNREVDERTCITPLGKSDDKSCAGKPSTSSTPTRDESGDNDSDSQDEDKSRQYGSKSPEIDEQTSCKPPENDGDLQQEKFCELKSSTSFSSARAAPGDNDNESHDADKGFQPVATHPGVENPRNSPALSREEDEDYIANVFKDLRGEGKFKEIYIPPGVEASFISEIAEVCDKENLKTHSISYWPFPEEFKDCLKSTGLWTDKKIIVVEGSDIESVTKNLKELLEEMNFDQYYEIGISNIEPQYKTVDGCPDYTIPLIKGKVPHYIDRYICNATSGTLRQENGVAGTVDTYVTDDERIFGVTAAHCFAIEQDTKRGVIDLASDDNMKELSLIIGGRAIQTHHITSTPHNEAPFTIRQPPLSLYRKFVSIPEKKSVASKADEKLQDPIEIEEQLMARDKDPIEIEEQLMAHDNLYLDISIVPFDMRDFRDLNHYECDLQSHVSSSTPHSGPTTTEIGDILDIKGHLRYLIDERICIYVGNVKGHIIQQRLPVAKSGIRMGVHFAFATDERLLPGTSGSGIRVFDERQKKYFLIGILFAAYTPNPCYPVKMYLGIPLRLALNKFQQVYPGHLNSELNSLYRSEKPSVDDLKRLARKEPELGDDPKGYQSHGGEEPDSGYVTGATSIDNSPTY